MSFALPASSRHTLTSISSSLWTAILLAIFMLFRTIGVSAFAAVGTMILLLPFQTIIARLFTVFQTRVLAAADDRLNLTTEVFQAIKALKFFAWEPKFMAMLSEKRDRELAALRKRVVVFALGGVSLCTFRKTRLSLTTVVLILTVRPDLSRSTDPHRPCHICLPHQGVPSTTRCHYSLYCSGSFQRPSRTTYVSTARLPGSSPISKLTLPLPGCTNGSGPGSRDAHLPLVYARILLSH